jgi:hypothetical protein
MHKRSLLMVTAILTLAAIVLPSPAAARDSVKVAVLLPTVPPTPIMFTNGNPYAPGTFAVGTIQLFYTVNALTFPSGEFASFTLRLGIRAGQPTGQQTSYPVPLSLRQTGSQNLILHPETDSYSVGDSSWSADDIVHISIPASVSADPDLNCDGCDLVGNLQLDAPGGNHLDTPTTVQVHIMLVHPKLCLRVFNFLTDQGFTLVPLTDAIVHLGGPARDRRVASSTPGQFSDNVLIVNACATAQSFNLEIALDPHFETKPGNGHGNAVFTYFTSGVVDPSAFDLSLFGSGTPQGQALWLENITLPAGASFLATVHMGLITGNPPSWLPPTSGTPAAGIFEGFWAELYAPGTTLSTLPSAPTASLAAPNPAETSLPFTVQ